MHTEGDGQVPPSNRPSITASIRIANPQSPILVERDPARHSVITLEIALHLMNSTRPIILCTTFTFLEPPSRSSRSGFSLVDSVTGEIAPRAVVACDMGGFARSINPQTEIITLYPGGSPPTTTTTVDVKLGCDSWAGLPGEDERLRVNLFEAHAEHLRDDVPYIVRDRHTSCMHWWQWGTRDEVIGDLISQWNDLCVEGEPKFLWGYLEEEKSRDGRGFIKLNVDEKPKMVFKTQESGAVKVIPVVEQ